MDMNLKRIERRCLALSVAFVFAVSCSFFGEDCADAPAAVPCEVSVKILAGSGSGTKSFIGGSAENAVNVLCVFVFDSSGNTVKAVCSDVAGGAPPESGFSLLSGDYMIYAIANCGDLRGIIGCENDLKEYVHEAGDESFRSAWMRDGIPMSGMTSFRAEAGSYSVALLLERLAARYSFRVDFSGFSRGSISVKSVSLKQCAAALCPFDCGYFIRGGHKVPVSADGNDGASDEDIEMLNSGGEAVFYVPENLQGTDGGINSQAGKIPSRMTQADPESCTYIEVECVYTDIGVVSDDLTYRMYIGENAVDNFDIRRNASYAVTLCPKEDNIRDGYWRCEATFDDSRSLGFSSDALLIRPAAPESVTRILSFPDGVRYVADFSGVLGEMAADGIYGVSLSVESGDVLKAVASDDDELFSLGKSYEYGINISTPDGEIKSGIPLMIIPANVYWMGESGKIIDELSLGYGETATVYCRFRHLSGYTGAVSESNTRMPSGVSFKKTGSLVDMSGWEFVIYEISNRCTENTTETFVKNVTVEITDEGWRKYLPELSADLAVTIKGSGFIPSARWLSSGSRFCDAHVGDSELLYIEDEATGEPYDVASVSIPASASGYLKLAGYEYAYVKGKTVRAARIDVSGTDGSSVEVIAEDEAGETSSAAISAVYWPVTLILENSETGRWHLRLKADNRNSIPFTFKITAVGTGHAGTITTEADAPNPQISGLRWKSSNFSYLGASLLQTDYYKDYVISESFAAGHDGGDGTAAYDLFTDTYYDFMNKTLLDMDRFPYVRWLSPGQPAVQDTARMEICALRFKVEIFADPEYLLTLPEQSFRFVDGLQPDAKWSALYSGYYDDTGYCYRGIWCYMNGGLMSGEPWEDSYPL